MDTPKIVTSIEVMPDSSYIVTADGNEAKFWDGSSLGLKKSFPQSYSVESATFCPEKSKFAVGGEDMWVHLHDYATGEEIECNKGVALCSLEAAAFKLFGSCERELPWLLSQEQAMLCVRLASPDLRLKLLQISSA